jgi:D-aminopeptidase
MRIAVVFDMEGTSHITDLREPFPTYREYWETGRAKLTDDIVAASRGLLAGGATEVWIYNHHGAGEVGWPNVIVERLPDRTRIVEDWNKLEMRDHVDAMFQVGAHARGGSPSFLSHTILPGLRLRLDGELLSESHWWAWTGNVPVLGIVGSAELGATRGTLGDVPFLAVQRSRDRRHVEPIFGSTQETASQIEAFATAAVRDASARRISTPAGPIRLEASIQNGDDAAAAMAEAGWTRTGRTSYATEAPSWRGDGEPINTALLAAIATTWVPYSFLFDGLDATSEETALAYPADQAAHDEAWLQSWAADATPEWFEPSAADGPWEGLA